MTKLGGSYLYNFVVNPNSFHDLDSAYFLSVLDLLDDQIDLKIKKNITPNLNQPLSFQKTVEIFEWQIIFSSKCFFAPVLLVFWSSLGEISSFFFSIYQWNLANYFGRNSVIFGLRRRFASIQFENFEFRYLFAKVSMKWTIYYSDINGSSVLISSGKISAENGIPALLELTWHGPRSACIWWILELSSLTTFNIAVIT